MLDLCGGDRTLLMLLLLPERLQLFPLPQFLQLFLALPKLGKLPELLFMLLGEVLLLLLEVLQQDLVLELVLLLDLEDLLFKLALGGFAVLLGHPKSPGSVHVTQSQHSYHTHQTTTTVTINSVIMYSEVISVAIGTL